MLCAALLAAVYEALKGYVGNPSHTLLDPDSFMRIVRIRDGLRTGWFTHVVAHDNGGRGTIVYWSHLLDATILVLRAPLRLVLGSQAALFWAAAITGPIFAGGLAASLAWAPLPLVPRPGWRWVWPAPFAILLLPALRTYGLLGYVHYHLPLVVLALLAAGCAGRAACTGERRAALWCGVWASLAVWLSPESLPYVLMSIGALALAWCEKPEIAGPAWRICAVTFAAGTVCAALIDPPAGGRFAPEIDCVSIVFATLAVLIAASSLALNPLARLARSTIARLAACALIGAVALGIWLALFPQVTHGLSGLIPAADVTAYFGAISEMQPTPATPRGAAMLAIGLAAIASAAMIAWRTRTLLWAYVAVCAAAIVCLAAFYVRFLGYAEAAGAVMLPIAMAHLSVPEVPASRVRRRATIAAFLLPALVAMLVPPRQAAGSASGMRGGVCNVADIAPMLARVPDAVVLTEISDTPEILWRTRARTVGSLYHRNIATFIRARNAWRSEDMSRVPQAVRDTGAGYILACDSLDRPQLIADLPKDTLQDRLTRHEVPSWLQPVGQVYGYRLYKIK